MFYTKTTFPNKLRIVNRIEDHRSLIKKKKKEGRKQRDRVRGPTTSIVWRSALLFLVALRDKLEWNGVSSAKLFDRPLFYSFRRDPAARHSIKLQVTQFTKQKEQREGKKS